MWHHTPNHWFVPGANYIITAGTYQKQRLFHDDARLQFFQQMLLDTFTRYHWEPQAWAVFSNHYHCIVYAPDDAASLRKLIRELHAKTANHINTLDSVPGRKVWHNYWDTCLTYRRSYFARLAYVMNNPVKHGLVSMPENYPYCSAAWFALHASPVFQKQIASFKCDKVNVQDDYD